MYLKGLLLDLEREWPDLKVDQLVEEEICDKYFVELTLGDLPKVSYDYWQSTVSCTHNYRIKMNPHSSIRVQTVLLNAHHVNPHPG